MTEYSLNNAELYYRNKEKDPADTQQELAEEFGCSRSTIGSRVRDFEDRLKKEDPAAEEELCDYMTKLYIGIELEDGETFSEELEGRTDATPEEYNQWTWYKKIWHKIFNWVERVFF